MIAREGEPGVGLFVILDGTAEVTIGGRKKATLGPGDFFGEIALLDGGPRTATVTCDDRCEPLGADRVGVPRAHGRASVDRPEDAPTDGGAAAERHQSRDGLTAPVARPSSGGGASWVRRRDDVQALAAERADRRATKDFPAADELRDRIAAAGWTVVDEPSGWRLEPIEATREADGSAADQRHRLDPGRARDGRRVDALGRRGVAGGRAPGDRLVPRTRGRPRRAVRRRGRHRRAATIGATTSRSSGWRPAPAGPQRATRG